MVVKTITHRPVDDLLEQWHNLSMLINCAIFILLLIFGHHAQAQTTDDLKQELSHLRQWSESAQDSGGDIVAKRRQQWQQLERFAASSKSKDAEALKEQLASEQTEDQVSSRLSGMQKTSEMPPPAQSAIQPAKKQLRKRSFTPR